ncbi:C2 domain-containing protein [Aureococcus anophagefferens]|nr:C2 domain-containing protein [Aureococcus anophagefferens]
MASMMDAATAVKKGAPFCHVYDFDATSACLLWSTIAKAPCYTLQMRVVTEGGGFPQWKTLSASVKGQRVRKNKLDADTAYEFRVAAMKRSAPALAAPVVFDADGDSATVTWSGGSPPFALQYALADDEAALGVNGGGPWKLAAARINGHVARKKNLQSGKKYAWRVKESDAPNCAWSRACDESPIPVPHAFMPRVFGEFLADKGGAKRPTGIALAGKVVAAAGKPFEVVWLSEENDEFEHARHQASIPWFSVPYKRAERETALEHFHISSLPRLVIISPAGKVLVDNAAADVATNFDAWVA